MCAVPSSAARDAGDLAPVPADGPTLDSLTVARSWHRRPQTKRISRDRAGGLVKRSFAKETSYAFTAVPIAGVEHLARVLEALSADRLACVVRGTPLPGIPVPARRLSQPDGDTPPTLAATPRRVVAIDMDAIDQGTAPDPARDPEGAVEHLIRALPEGFRRASCWWQFTSSQGTTRGKLHARLWFVLDRPVSDEDMRRWGHATNRAAGLRLVDPALYNPAQVHYVAAPIFDGIADPLPLRSGFRRGESGTAGIVVPERVVVVATTSGDGLRTTHGFESHLAEIGGEHGFNNAIFRAISSYIGTHGVESTEPLALRGRLRAAILDAPRGHRSEAEVRRYASDHYLDGEITRALRRKAAGEQRRQPYLAAGTEGPEPHYPAQELPPAEASRRLAEVVGRAVDDAMEWLPSHGPAPQVAIKAAAGLGKTRAFLDALAGQPVQPEVAMFVPTGDLAEEVVAAARERGLRARVIRGREAVVDGQPLCRKHREARRAASAGLNVRTTLCRKIAEGGTEERCPHFEWCPYLQQFGDRQPALRVAPHQYLRTGMAESPGPGEPALVAIDEGFALGGATVATFPLDTLTRRRDGMADETFALIYPVACRVRDALERGEDPRGAADAATFAELAKLELAADDGVDVTPGMSPSEQAARLGRIVASPKRKLRRLWLALHETSGKEGPLQTVVLRQGRTAGGDPVRLVHVHYRKKLHGQWRDVPTLALDASLDATLVRKFLPRAEVETIAARRNAEVIQAHDTACSRNRLLSFDGAPEAERQRADNRLRDVRRLAEVEVARARRDRPDARVLLVTYLEAERRLLAEGPIDGVDIAHFGALRGVDRYRDHATVIIAGREQPPPQAAEDTARALHGDDDTPLTLLAPGQRLPTEERGYRMRDGSRRGVPVEVHPDPRVQAVHEQTRESESGQAIDRARLVHREQTARVIMLSNVVLDLTVDRLVTWGEIIPDRLAVAAARLDGVLPLSSAWLAERFPDLWATVSASENEVGRFSNPQTPNDTFYLGFEGFTTASYRVAGRRGGRPGRALIRADHLAPEAALAALVGPLSLFRPAAPPPAAPEALPALPSSPAPFPRPLPTIVRRAVVRPSAVPPPSPVPVPPAPPEPVVPPVPRPFPTIALRAVAVCPSAPPPPGPACRGDHPEGAPSRTPDPAWDGHYALDGTPLTADGRYYARLWGEART